VRYITTILLLLLLSSLAAQIQVLPDIEVSGESQVKIFLYKKALPYSTQALAGDSLRAFLPQSLPEPIPAEILLLKLPLRHYLHAEASSRMRLEADYRYLSPHPNITSLGLGMSLYAPKGNLLSNHYRGFSNFLAPSEEDIALNLRYYNSDGSGLNSEFGAADLQVYKEQYRFDRFNLNRVSTGFGVYGIKQSNAGLGLDRWGLKFSHQSVFDLPDYDWGNRIYLHKGYAAWHSYLDLELMMFDKASMNVIYDGEHFLPVPGFVWRYITDFDQQFSISNDPQTWPNDYAPALEKYRWAFLKYAPSIAPNTTIPLNLSFRLEDYQSTSSQSFLRKFAVENRSQYRLNEALPTISNNPDIPGLYFDDVFSNESMITASFGQGSVTFDQSFALDLAYLSSQDWRRVPYNALLKAESAIRYAAYPYVADVALNQHYFTLDHLQQDLPEVFDLSLGAAYEFGAFDQVYIRLENLLNAYNRPFKTLPNRGFSITVGIHHRF
jgi:hypothetical protein